MDYVWAMLTLAAVLADSHFYIHDTVLVVAGTAGALSAVAKQSGVQAMAWASLAWILLACGLMPQSRLGLNVFTPFLIAAFIAFGMRLRSESASRMPDSVPAEAKSYIAA